MTWDAGSTYLAFCLCITAYLVAHGAEWWVIALNVVMDLAALAEALRPENRRAGW